MHLRTRLHRILALALVAGALGCSSSSGQPCGCAPGNVCLVGGGCAPVCGADAGACPAGLGCAMAEPYCATQPCPSTLVMACVAGASGLNY